MDGTVQVAETNEEKGRLLQDAFFLKPGNEETGNEEQDYPPPALSYALITDMQIHRVICQLGPHKAPSPDGITNIVFIKCADLLVPLLGPIYHTTFELKVYPEQWRDSITVVLRKPVNPDYTVPGAHWPITLLNTIVEILSACVTEDLAQMSEIHGLLTANHFGCR